MQARLFELFGTGFPSYFVLLVSGFMLATLAGAAWAKRLGQDPDVIVDLGLSMLIFGVIGARLLHVLADGYFWDYVHLCTDPSQVEWRISRAECERVFEPDFVSALFGAEGSPVGRFDAEESVCRPVASDCFAWARFWAGGLTYYGGLLGASAAAFFLLRRDRFPFLLAADMAGLVVPIGLTMGRLGCLLGGCCFGAPLEAPWALSFPPYSAASQAQEKLGLLSHASERSLHVHPTQLYEAFACFFLAVGLLLWSRRKRYHGQVFLRFLAGYSVIRFALEFYRADDRGGFWGLSTSQWVSLLLLLVAFLLSWRLSGAKARAVA